MNPNRIDKLIAHLKADRRPDYIQYMCTIEEIVSEIPISETATLEKSRAYAALRHRREREEGLATHDDFIEQPWH